MQYKNKKHNGCSVAKRVSISSGFWLQL